MRDEVVWDDEECDDVMSLDMTDRELVPLPMCLQTCERMEGEREGKHLAAAGTSDPTIQCVNFLRLGQAWLKLPHPCHSTAAVHAPTSCVCECNWSI